MWSGHPAMLPKQLYWAVLVAICAYALWRGRHDERIVAVTCLLASIATKFAISPIEGRYGSVEFGVFLVDLAVLAVFTGIALKSQRFWPLWVAGLQLTTSIAHLLKAIELDLLPVAYAAAGRFWSYPILLILAVGTWRTHQRARLEQQVALP